MKKLLLSLSLMIPIISSAATIILDGKRYEVTDVTVIASGVTEQCAHTNIPSFRELSPNTPARYFDMPEGRIYSFEMKPTKSGSISLYSIENPVSKLITISKCPGDFRVGYVDVNCVVSNSSDLHLDYTIDYKNPGCLLEEGETYFINVRNAYWSNPGLDTCTDGRNCSMTIIREE